MDDFQDRSDRFLTWFKDNGGEFRDDLIQITDMRSRNAGRGIVAIKDIPKDTVLFTVPRTLILNVETSDLARKIPAVFADSNDADGNEEALDSWSQLILVMLYEFLQGSSSRWNSYLDILPENFDTPIFWSEPELEELKGTCLTAEKIGRQESDHMLRTRILPVVKDNAALFYANQESQLQDSDLLALAHRMGSTIMAYAFDLENEDEQPVEEEDGWEEDREGKTMLGMVPLADILNANAEFNAHVNHGEKIEITSLRSNIEAGSEILNYYGPLPTSELLRRYGYITPEHRRYDVVEIAWSTVRAELGKLRGVPEAILKHTDSDCDGDDFEDYFVIERDSGEPDEQGRLIHPAKLRRVSVELEEQFKAYVEKLKTFAPEVVNDKRKRDEMYDKVLLEVLTSKLTEYGSVIERTTEHCRSILAQNDIPLRRRMAIEVRLGEISLLLEAISLSGGSSLTSDDPDASVPREKRSKR